MKWPRLLLNKLNKYCLITNSRAGRTARAKSGGNSLLILTPSEKTGMLKMMKSRKPPVNLDLWEVNKDLNSDITPKLRALCVEREEIKGFASRAFVAYAKHVHLQKVFYLQKYYQKHLNS